MKQNEWQLINTSAGHWDGAGKMKWAHLQEFDEGRGPYYRYWILGTKLECITVSDAKYEVHVIYSWQCANSHVTEVECKMADMDTPPTKCAECEETALTRIIVRPKGVQGYILEGSGWFRDGYVRSMHRKKYED